MRKLAELKEHAFSLAVFIGVCLIAIWINVVAYQYHRENKSYYLFNSCMRDQGLTRDDLLRNIPAAEECRRRALEF